MFSSLILSVILSFSSLAKNVSNDSFSKAKHMLERDVYVNASDRITIYCGAVFDKNKKVSPPNGFSTDKYVKRAKRVEWEHVVPAENFGRTFSAWREGDRVCVTKSGKHYKGRRCANKASEEYKYMQADMYNLYPAIGAVNALRQNYNFQAHVNTGNSFGSCEMRIKSRKAEPPKSARGKIARSYLYMDKTYTHYHMSDKQRQLMNAWNKKYPATQWECERAERINKLQEGQNEILNQSCHSHG